MRKLLLTTGVLASALFAATHVASAAQIVGTINIDGSNSYSEATHTVSFIGQQNAQSDTGDLAAFGTCFGCIAAKKLVYSPFSAVTGEFTGTHNGHSLAIDLVSLTTVTQTPTFLDLAGPAVIHLTGFTPTPGHLFFSTQGPQGIEVSFSSTALTPAPEPTSLALFGVGLIGLGLVGMYRVGRNLR